MDSGRARIPEGVRAAAAAFRFQIKPLVFVYEGGAVYTTGIWNVKEGHEDEFRRRWQESVDAVSLELPGIVFRLLRDVESPRRFTSNAGPWRSLEQITALRNSAEFKESMASMAKHLDSYEISTCELVAEVS